MTIRAKSGRKSLWRASLLATGLVLCCVLLLLILLLDTRPAVQAPVALTDEDKQRIEQLIVDNSPSRFTSSGERILQLNTEEIALLSTLALENFIILNGLRTRIELHQAAADVTVSSPPWHLGPATFYLNITTSFEEREEQLILARVTAGSLSLPAVVQKFLLVRAQREFAANSLDYEELADLQYSIRRIRLTPDHANIHLQWEPTVLSKLRTQAQQLFVSTEDQERISHYYQRIVELSEAIPDSTRSVSVQEFLPALFTTASQRSRDGEDPIAENRAVLQALSLYVNRLPLDQLTDDSAGTVAGNHRQLTVTLQHRHDLARHFVTSAALAASAGAGIAEILANSKEFHDARYRTGFSFSDMTANIAGVTLGAALSQDHRNALNMQNRLASAQMESWYMPTISGPDEALTEEEFTERYQDRNSDSYLARLTEIEQQLAALPLYHSVEQH